MTLRFRLVPLVLAALPIAALPAHALAQSVEDFQLPPAPSPTASPRVQGPVDEEAGPVPVRPRAIPTARATPRPAVTPPAPTPTATAAARIPTAQPASRATRAAPTGAGPAEVPPIAPRETLPVEPFARPTTLPTTPAVQAPVASPAPLPAPVPPAEDEAPVWPWLAGLAALALAGAGFAAWRRRRTPLPPPAIEPPLARGSGAPVAGALAQALSLRAEAVKLTRSFAFATLDYRLTLINRTDRAMSDLAVSADLVSANGQAPMEHQIALPGTILPVRHTLARLSPGQSQQLKGQVRLPIGEAQVIRQGRLPLLVPLLRVRIGGAGEDVLARTFVIGQGQPDGGRLQPFRLDEPPRSYQPVAQRALD